MHRRSLFASAGSVALLGLTGCGVRLDSPTIKGSPAPTYTPPPPTPYPPGGSEIAVLETAAWAALLGAAAVPGADSSSLGKLAAIRAAHVSILTSKELLWRRPAASPPTPPAPAPAPATANSSALTLAGTALTALREAVAARAVSESGLPAALWGSLAASAEQARLWLAVPVGSVTPAAPGRVVTVREDASAFSLLLERYHEAVYGFSSLLGFLPNAHPLRPALSAQLTAARTRRDALVAYDRAASAGPQPGAGAYSVPPVAADQVVAEAGALLTSVTQAAGVWVASATDARRARAVQELLYAASVGQPLGTGLAEWPGWPD